MKTKLTDLGANDVTTFPTGGTVFVRAGFPFPFTGAGVTDLLGGIFFLGAPQIRTTSGATASPNFSRRSASVSRIYNKQK